MGDDSDNDPLALVAMSGGCFIHVIIFITGAVVGFYLAGP